MKFDFVLIFCVNHNDDNDDIRAMYRKVLDFVDVHNGIINYINRPHYVHFGQCNVFGVQCSMLIHIPTHNFSRKTIYQNFTSVEFALT